MLSKTDQAKYPIVPEAVEFVRDRGLTVDELADRSYAAILDRAEERLRQAIEIGSVSSEWQDDNVEILSFPVAVYLTTVLQDDWVRRRFALAESRRASHFLVTEDAERIAEIASRTFGWKIQFPQKNLTGATPSLRIGFKNYVKNAVRIREAKWKLINRQLIDGFVRVSREEASRLLEEEIQHRILDRMKGPSEEPSYLKERIERLRKLVTQRKGTGAFLELPKTVMFAAMPPCIRHLYDSVQSGRHIPHVGRFALTCFLVNVGASEEEILRLFKTAADFDERKTRYQVEHIAGSKGRKTKYTPPKCTTLKTHGLCISPDTLCRTVSHPLSYYRRKIRPAMEKDRQNARS